MNTKTDPIPVTTISQRPLPRVRLTDQGGKTIVAAPAVWATAAGGQAEPFATFPLPKLPRSTADRAADLLARVWHVHRRCAAAVLLLDVRTRTWSIALPRQRCGLTSSSWDGSAVTDDISDGPEGLAPVLVLTGSVQVRVLTAGEDPAEAVPPDDGLHVVWAAGTAGLGSVHRFLRIDAVVTAAPPESVVIDDAGEMLRRAMPRLKML